jgi:hypothetical protein
MTYSSVCLKAALQGLDFLCVSVSRQAVRYAHLFVQWVPGTPFEGQGGRSVKLSIYLQLLPSSRSCRALLKL